MYLLTPTVTLSHIGFRPILNCLLSREQYYYSLVRIWHSVTAYMLAIKLTIVLTSISHNNLQPQAIVYFRATVELYKHSLLFGPHDLRINLISQKISLFRAWFLLGYLHCVQLPKFLASWLKQSLAQSLFNFLRRMPDAMMLGYKKSDYCGM